MVDEYIGEEISYSPEEDKPLELGTFKYIIGFHINDIRRMLSSPSVEPRSIFPLLDVFEALISPINEEDKKRKNEILKIDKAKRDKLTLRQIAEMSRQLDFDLALNLFRILILIAQRKGLTYFEAAYIRMGKKR